MVWEFLVTLWSNVKHKKKSNTQDVLGDRQKCKGYPTRAEGVGVDADEVIRRMRQLHAVKSDTALATALDLAPSAPSNWRQRNRPPLALCVRMALTHGVSLDWLVLGVGDVRAKGAGQVRDASEAVYRSSSDVAARITRFVAQWDASRAPAELIWLEQHLRRTVPEYDKWLAGQGEDALPPPS